MDEWDYKGFYIEEYVVFEGGIGMCFCFVFRELNVGFIKYKFVGLVFFREVNFVVYFCWVIVEWGDEYYFCCVEFGYGEFMLIVIFVFKL